MHLLRTVPALPREHGGKKRERRGDDRKGRKDDPRGREPEACTTATAQNAGDDDERSEGGCCGYEPPGDGEAVARKRRQLTGEEIGEEPGPKRERTRVEQREDRREHEERQVAVHVRGGAPARQAITIS